LFFVRDSLVFANRIEKTGIRFLISDFFADERTVHIGKEIARFVSSLLDEGDAVGGKIQSVASSS